MYLILAVVCIIAYIIVRQLDIKRRWFAWFISYITVAKNPKYDEMKKDLFASLSTCVSHLPELRKRNTLKILEIGVGTGVNFEYYPEGTNLVVVDPNPHFKSYYDQNRAKFKNIASEEVICTTAEEMDMIESNSVDIVVLSLVLCSVPDVSKLIKQIHRVLVQGGKFYYFEHIFEWDTKRSRGRLILQELFVRTYLFPFIFQGCNFNRDTLKCIEEAGFSKVDAQKVRGPTNTILFWLIQPHLVGTATK